MALDTTPDEIVTRTRDEIRDRYTRDYRLRIPDADTGSGTQPYVDASVFADAQMALYADAQTIGKQRLVRGTLGSALDDLGAEKGITRPPAAGASGYVEVSASSGGGTILAGDEIKDAQTGLRFKCLATALYADGDSVPIVGIDTGPSTNLAAGTVLEWTSPRPGIGPTATVVEQSDGSGLSGGRDAASDEEYQDVIIEWQSNPPAAGNDAEYQYTVEHLSGLAVQKCFTVPAIKGPGTCGVMFTMRPAKTGASRLPNSAQLAIAEAALKAKEPADDGILVCSLLAQSVAVVLRATWAKGASGWTDATQWPAYIAGDLVKVDGAVTPTTTSCRLTTGTATTAPTAGKTVGFYDLAKGAWRRKRILAVTEIVAGTSWNVTFDTANGVSDTSYAPATGTICSPWSESLTDLVTPIAGYIDTLGPGEQVGTFYDPGSRQRRQPESPSDWPNVISNRLIRPVLDLASIADADLVSPTVPYATTIGTPGVSSYILQLGDLAIYPQ